MDRICLHTLCARLWLQKKAAMPIVFFEYFRKDTHFQMLIYLNGFCGSHQTISRYEIHLKQLQAQRDVFPLAGSLKNSQIFTFNWPILSLSFTTRQRRENVL